MKRLRISRTILAGALMLGAAALASAANPSISARNAHVLVSRSDGTVVAWGSDVYGRLGTARPIYRTMPQRLIDLPPIAQISQYSVTTLALDRSGRVWSWGRNDSAELGLRVQRNAARPGRIQDLSGVTQIATGDAFNAALRSDGTVWIWGATGSFGTTVKPMKLEGLTAIAQIAMGSNHLFARRSDGTVYGYGWNNFSQLGIGAPSVSNNGGFENAPVKVLLPTGVVDIAAVSQGGFARTADGNTWEWGSTGDPNQPSVSTPRIVSGLPSPVTRLMGGFRYAVVIVDNGDVWRWEIGATPSRLNGFTNVRHASVSNFTFIAVGTDGRLRVMGANSNGERGLGTTGGAVGDDVTVVPAPINFSTAEAHTDCVIGLTEDGQVWTWGLDVNGSLGDGATQSWSTPLPVAGVANITQVVAGNEASVALDGSGNAWIWGNNSVGQFGNGSTTPSSTPVQVPIANVKAIASGWGQTLFLKQDGTLWFTGPLNGMTALMPQQLVGLPPIRAIAAGWSTLYAITTAGKVFASGDNRSGTVGNGTTTPQLTPVQIDVPGDVVQVVADFHYAMAVNTAGEVYAWGESQPGLLGNNPGISSPITTPSRVAGLAGVVELALTETHFLARLQDGTVMSWGSGTEALGRDYGNEPWLPGKVADLDSVIAIAAGYEGSFAIRSDGTVWGWGRNFSSGGGPSVGDGTFVRQSRPVVVIRENAQGSLDMGNWFLDAKPEVVTKTIPAKKVPGVIASTKSLSSSAVLNVDATLNVKSADLGKKVSLYVVGLVPPAFLSQVKMAPGSQALPPGTKADAQILVTLTPSGWTIAAGQLSAYQTSTNNAAIAAANLLVNIDPASIPGARFCIGYGESATDMLQTGTMRDFLSLEGAQSTTLPCLLSGVYIDGPSSSVQGTSVPLRAVVIGQSPTGRVRFAQAFGDISSDINLDGVNAAISQALLSYKPPAPGELAFSASYAGDALNVAAKSDVPLRHTVKAVQAQSTTRLAAPVSSEIGSELRLVATVSGNRPGGTVQLTRNGANEGAAVAVVDDQAVFSVVGLGLGDHIFAAAYSGDTANSASAAAGLSHRVLDVASTTARLGSSSNPTSVGDAITVTVTVSGETPTGTVSLREGGLTLGGPVTLANGQANFVLSTLTAGLHVMSADYSGDATNPKTTSNALFQQVSLNIPAGGDLDGDGIPNGVEAAAGSRPDLKDNDIFAVARLFAMQQYRDFLGREGDAGGVTFWTSQLSTGAQNRGQMVETYFNSAEFQGTGAPVGRLYFAYFLRIPDYGGLNFWIGQFRTGSSLETISNAFAGSPEFNNRYGALTNAQFVSLVYQNVLGRAPDAAGLSYWTGQINGGMTRGQMMVAFSESAEYRALIDSEVYVTMMYVGMLRRAPDAGGFTFWVGYKDAGNSGLALINGFLAAPEYRNRFLP